MIFLRPYDECPANQRNSALLVEQRTRNYEGSTGLACVIVLALQRSSDSVGNLGASDFGVLERGTTIRGLLPGSGGNSRRQMLSTGHRTRSTTTAGSHDGFGTGANRGAVSKPELCMPSPTPPRLHPVVRKLTCSYNHRRSLSFFAYRSFPFTHLGSRAVKPWSDFGGS
jgi:hypothetical protein